MGFGLIVTEAITSSWDNVRTNTNRVGLSGIKNIVGLGLSGAKSKSFFWYNVRAETNQWWNCCSGREDPLTMGADAEAVGAAERWDNAVGRW